MTSIETRKTVDTGKSKVGGNLSDLSEVLSPIQLPCGRVLPNRLVKAAMYEHLASFLGGPPNDVLNSLYTVWARGGWGMVITGNIQVSHKHLSLGADIVIPCNLTEGSLQRFKHLAKAIKDGTAERRDSDSNWREACPLAIMQLNHTGRQSPNGLGGRWPFIQPPLSASATRVGTSYRSHRGGKSLLTRAVHALLFQRARAMTEADVKDTIDSFVRGASVAVRSGFDGIQIHAAHGYLITQFISRKTNLRNDAYSPPLAFLHEIVRGIRSNVPRSFIVGLKINTADYVTGGFGEMDGIAHLSEIAGWNWNGVGVDFIEISGGDYESPEFLQDSSLRQVFFESFSRVAVRTVEQEHGAHGPKDVPPPLVMLTGGLRTRAQFSRVLERKHAHLLGVARLSVLKPDLPNLLRNYHEIPSSTRDDCDKSFQNENEEDEDTWIWETQPSPEPRSPGWWPNLVGAGVGMAWYVVGMHRLAQDRNLPFGEHWLLVVLEMYFGERRVIGGVFAVFIAIFALLFVRG